VKTTLKILFLCIFTVSCISSTYYQSRFTIKITDSYHVDKEGAVRNINHIANLFNLNPDKRATNNDSISFFGPPYHYIQFIFDRNENADSIEFTLNYDGRMASKKLTDGIYFGIKMSLDSLYGERIKYTLIKKNYNP
jgi:hypothetical protein